MLQIDSGGRLSCAISTEGLLSCWGRYNIQEQPDTDNDGYDASVDCDDNNREIYPQAIGSYGNAILSITTVMEILMKMQPSHTI